jgi:mannosyltransferase
MDKKAYIESSTINPEAERIQSQDDTNIKAFALSETLASRLIWIIVGLGALLRLSTLGMQSFWLDESITYWTVNRSLPALAEDMATASRPLFFYIVYLFYLVGEHEWVLRLPSALAGIAGVGLIYVLGWELFDRRTGLLAAALLALSPLHLWYSQEARFYALVGLLGLAAVLFAVRGLKYNRGHDWVLFGLFMGLGLWTESGAIWLILAINLAGLLLLRSLFQGWRIFGWALAQAVGVIVYLPRLVTFVESVQGGSTSWIPPATVREVLRVLSDFSGGFMQPAWFGILSLLGIGLSLLLGLVWMLKEAKTRWLAYAVLLPWLVVPISASFVISQPYYRPDWLLEIIGSRPSVFLTRNLITILFPLLLLAARSLALMTSLSAIGWRRIGMGLAAGVIFLYAIGYSNNHLVLRKEDYRSAAQMVAAEVGSNDLVLTSPGYIEQPLGYYYFDRIFNGERPSDLSLLSLRDGVLDSNAIRQYPAALMEIEENLEVIILEHERVWMVTNDNIHQPPDQELLAYLDQHGELQHASQFNDVLVELYIIFQTGAP